MFKSTYQVFAQSVGLSAFVLLAVAACAGKGDPAQGPQASTFKPSYLGMKISRENFSHPSGGIVTAQARQYMFRDGSPKDITVNISAETPAGQGMLVVGETKYVATDFCAGFNSELPGHCDYAAVMLYRAQGEKNETRSTLFKRNQAGEFEFICSRDVLYKDGAEAFEKLKAECDPDPAATPSPSATPAPTPTPTP